MPLRPSAFTILSRYVDSRVNPAALTPLQAAPDFDWGFDLDVPWERLSIFTRHLGSAGPLSRVPIFALVEFGLTADSAAALDDVELVESIRFPALPLGVVGTDHVGYGSFDLWPVRNLTVLQSLKMALTNAELLEAGNPRLTVRLTKVLVLPYKDPTISFEVLTEGDVGPDFLCLRMDLDVVMLAGRETWPAMPSMQTPSIDDWRMSPGSFSMAGAMLIGEDGCETLLPANLATRMVRFRQLIRTPSEAMASGRGEPPRFFELPGFSGKMRLGFNVNYQSEWFPVGHSLGQIAYSLPLAPGEKMKIAVVDWARHDAAKRSEQTTEKEDLQHAALRDRTLTEAVQMVVKESQSGSSFMAGGALSAGAGIPIGPVSMGVGGAFGVGGASTDSEGMRSVVGDTTQKISDAFHQASSAQRELNSTVVVQADQAEAAEARTRIVANYNHSHALTILYYEVLQHHRVLTKPASVRPAIFLKHEATPFDFSLSAEPDYTLIERYMGEIAANLLDESLRGCLEVVKKRACLKINFDREKKKRDEQGMPSDDHELGEFSFWVLSGAVGSEMNIYLRVIPKAGGTPIDCVFTDLSIVAITNQFDSNGQVISLPVPTILSNYFVSAVTPHRIRPNEEFLATVRPTQKIRWGNVAAIEVTQTIAPALSIDDGRRPADWNVQKMRFVTEQGVDKWQMFDGTPAPPNVKWDGSTRANVVPFTRPLISVDDLLSNDERCCLARLVSHLNKHAGHYWRAIWLAEIPADRAVRFDGWTVNGVPLLDIIDNTLLAVDGEYLVLPISAGGQ
ncbi:hypothetical protein LJR255_004376 [Pararhizobium sp. LjRoot255]|uniref:hypothetical protein n=1 Tax=Pararhizobium sp. LjRoot255 TaxID=3342298 RepID=UPI003ECE359A